MFSDMGELNLSVSTIRITLDESYRWSIMKMRARQFDRKSKGCTKSLVEPRICGGIKIVVKLFMRLDTFIQG